MELTVFILFGLLIVMAVVWVVLMAKALRRAKPPLFGAYRAPVVPPVPELRL